MIEHVQAYATPRLLRLPGVLLVLCIQLVSLLSFLCHPSGHQLLVVLCGLPQLLLQSREGDLECIILILQGLVGPLQVLREHIQKTN